MKLALVFSILLALCGVIADAAEQVPPSRPLDILTEEWGPITFEEHGQARGFAVDVVDAIQQRIKSNNIIQVVPWTRGFREVKTQPNVVLFTVFRSKEREKLFTLLGPIATCEVSFYGLADGKLPVKNLDDAKRVIAIAAKADTWFATTLEKAGFKNLLLTKNPQQEALLLAAGRVDLISNDPIVIEKAFEEIGKKDLKLKRYLTVEKGDLYIAFSRGTPPPTIERWKKALEDIKNDGTFAALQQKWLPDTKMLPGVQLIGYGTGTDIDAGRSLQQRLGRNHRDSDAFITPLNLVTMP